MPRTPGPSTAALHADRPHNPTPSVSPAIFQTSTFRWEAADDGARLAAERSPATFYSRMGNPNVHQLEAIVSALEGSEAALATASGAAPRALRPDDRGRFLRPVRTVPVVLDVLVHHGWVAGMSST